jgi:hypothetical protein
MYPYPSFNPDQFTQCYRAYTSALLDIQYENGGSNQEPPGKTTCLAVALRIIEASAKGERDVSRLKQFALHELIERQQTFTSADKTVPTIQETAPLVGVGDVN